MALNQRQPKRRVGLTASSHFASLHSHAHDKRAEAVSKKASSDEESITAPPKSSDESSTSSSSSDEPSSLKRRKLSNPSRSSWTANSSFEQSPGQPVIGAKEEETDVSVFAPQRKMKTKYSKSSNKNPNGNKAGSRLGKREKDAKRDEFRPLPAMSTIAKEKPMVKTNGPDFRTVEIRHIQLPKPESGPTFKVPPKSTIPRNQSKKQKKAVAGNDWKDPTSQLSTNGTSTKSTRSSRSKPSLEQTASSFRPPLNLENLAKKFDLENDVAEIRSQPHPQPSSPSLDITSIQSLSPLSSTHSLSSSSLSSLAATEVNEPASSSTSLATTLNLASLSSAPNSAPTPIASCPLCKSSVPPSLLEDFTARLRNPTSNAPWSVHQQAAFHKIHLTAEAELLWETRHYPIINWVSLPSRFEQLKPHLTSVLEGKTPSFYRSRLQNTVEGTARRTRTVAHELATGQDGAEDVGYYGSKGQRLMGDWLIATYSPRLRELAVIDRDIASAGGVGAFVQKVLMPELAHGLIMKDLEKEGKMGAGVRGRAWKRCKDKEADVRKRFEGQGYDAEEVERKVKEGMGAELSVFHLREKEGKEWVGRWIAEESADVGRLVCEEEDDEIPQDADEDEGEGR